MIGDRGPFTSHAVLGHALTISMASAHQKKRPSELNPLAVAFCRILLLRSSNGMCLLKWGTLTIGGLPLDRGQN